MSRIAAIKVTSGGQVFFGKVDPNNNPAYAPQKVATATTSRPVDFSVEVAGGTALVHTSMAAWPKNACPLYLTAALGEAGDRRAADLGLPVDAPSPALQPPRQIKYNLRKTGVLKTTSPGSSSYLNLGDFALEGAGGTISKQGEYYIAVQVDDPAATAKFTVDGQELAV